MVKIECGSPSTLNTVVYRLLVTLPVMGENGTSENEYKQDVDFQLFCKLCRTEKTIILSCIASEMGTFLNKLCAFFNASSCSYIAMCTLL